MKRIHLFILSIIVTLNIFAQQFQVESFKRVSDNASAVQEVMKDINDTPCALLRVKTNEANVKIAGNTIGDVMTNGTEYLVNVATGTKKFTVVKKGFYPLTVVCSDYDFNSMKSNGLYELKLKKINISNEVSGEIDGHEYVDLGLSVKWATYNIGANQTDETGSLFKYGETEPYVEERPYTFMEDSGFADWIELKSNNDVAHKKWGVNWRMPTYEEWVELRRNCQMIWTTKNGISGALFIAKNGNKLFLPSSEWMPLDENSVQCLKYWTTEGGALKVKFSIAEISGTMGSYWRIFPSMGFCVRAVSDLPKEPEVWQNNYSMKPDGYNNGHGYVDLGLSVKWATKNIDAHNVADVGSRFLWASPLPPNNDNRDVYEDRTKNKYGNTNATVIKMEDDAARVQWKANWRIPTKKEMEELVNNCTWTWTYNYMGKGLDGYIVTSKISGYTDKSIFFPCYSWPYHGYWTSGIKKKDIEYFGNSEAFALCFNPYHYHMWNTTIISECMIRPVF